MLQAIHKLSNLKKALLISVSLHFSYVGYIRNQTQDLTSSVLEVTPENPVIIDVKPSKSNQESVQSKLDFLQKLAPNESLVKESILPLPSDSRPGLEPEPTTVNQLQQIFADKYSKELFAKYKDRFTPENF